MADFDDSTIARFWSKVDKDGPVPAHALYLGPCWEWTRTKNPAYYGALAVGGKLVRINRLSWMLAHGPIPDGLCVLHHCDNRHCVRPSHLFLGTHADNVEDMVRKGRHGAANGTDHYRRRELRPRPKLGDRHWTRRRPEDLKRGEKNHATKLTAEQVLEARRRAASGESYRSIARLLCVAEGTIRFAVKGVTWAHLVGQSIEGSNDFRS